MNDFPILLVEDNPDDAFLMQRAWKTAGVTQRLEVVEDGQQAIAYLERSRQAEAGPATLPLFVLLDLKLPHRSGFEVLEWIRTDSTCRTLLVIVLTSSSERRDIERCYQLGANSYLVKPSEAKQLADLAGCLKQYWINHNAPPPLRQG